MPSIIFYILKLSVALAAVYIFYLLVLRRLTFYNWNRWYLLGYTILAFLIPFINIAPILNSNEWSDTRIINWVPAITENNSLQNIHDNAATNLSAWNIMTLVFFSGMLFLLARLVIQFISFHRMKKKAKPFAENGLTIYQVNENIIPFSFGKSIFINHQLHSEEELREIIRHEFIHVKQNHSIDIIWGELLCLINWYNPFAWLLKKAIRQNLEFIADNKVIQDGIDKKEYQYLLLKVIGNSQYSIATQFNFSSLKKRIAMMNKTKSARLQVGRFLFLVPVFVIILLAFRNSFNDSTNAKTNMPMVALTDTIPDVKTPNSKGYYIDIKDDKGNCTVVIKDKNKKEMKRLLLTDWDANETEYMKTYGEILLPPEASRIGSCVLTTILKYQNQELLKKNMEKSSAIEPIKDVPEHTEVPVITKVFTSPAKEVTVIAVEPATGIAVQAENPVVTTVSVSPAKEVTVVGKPLTKTIPTNPDMQEVLVTGAPTKRAVSTTGEIKEVTVVGKPVKTIATDPEVTNEVYSETEINEGNGNGLGYGKGNGIGIGEEEILFIITKKTTAEELESLVKKMKEKGYELKFTNKGYNDGVLTQVSGIVKYKDSNSSFSATDFSKLTISTYRDGDKIRFKIFIGTKKGIS